MTDCIPQRVPVGGGSTVARWGVLGRGALAGRAIMFEDRGHRFNLFHARVLFAILAAPAVVPSR